MANPLRPALLAAARSPRIARTLTGMRSTKRVVDRFVAGETEEQAVAAADALLISGRYLTVDYLGEDITEIGQARDTVEHYLRLLSALAELPPMEDAESVRPLEVSLKLSALGQSLPKDGHAIALEHAHTICTAAAVAGAWVTIDAEDHTTTDSTLSIVRELRADFPWLGTVLQAYLHRTEGDCRDFAGPGSRIRLCKGAYAEPPSVAHQGKIAVDQSYLRCLRILMEGKGYPMVATHDPAIIESATRMVVAAGRKRDEFEFQMLYGIRDAEQRRLVTAGNNVRVYVPYGNEWYGYFMRRLAERPANLTFFLRAMAERNHN
ncbi:proline dehydrogenase family protein [Nocardia arthritidis]|uniref:proline dehydrogenase n=1 Tax=Nocardia arthritidis TaxID=228602 RepID=A0A6G9YEX0_9NOCA|nr:proline dehydrogenase family protein [Nocardia arthritidis]QIS11771.1 proline dehydrogenase [Nocardia arthritidis]